MIIPKTCQFCNQVFIAQTTVTKNCGDACAKKAYKKRKRDEKIKASLEADQQKLQSQQSLQTSSKTNLFTRLHLKDV